MRPTESCGIIGTRLSFSSASGTSQGTACDLRSGCGSQIGSCRSCGGSGGGSGGGGKRGGGGGLGGIGGTASFPSGGSLRMATGMVCTHKRLREGSKRNTTTPQSCYDLSIYAFCLVPCSFNNKWTAPNSYAGTRTQLSKHKLVHICSDDFMIPPSGCKNDGQQHSWAVARPLQLWAYTVLQSCPAKQPSTSSPASKFARSEWNDTTWPKCNTSCGSNQSLYCTEIQVPCEAPISPISPILGISALTYIHLVT